MEVQLCCTRIAALKLGEDQRSDAVEDLSGTFEEMKYAYIFRKTNFLYN